MSLPIAGAFAYLALLPLSITGCSDDSPPDGSSGAAGVSGVAGSSAGNGDAGAAGSPDDTHCPSTSSSYVHYASQDPAQCAAIDLSCTDSQNGFFNACGCGCVDRSATQCEPPTDPSIHYFSQDPSQCPDTPLACASGQIGFSNACGCGCLDR